jgi:hypothetical protein
VYPGGLLASFVQFWTEVEIARMSWRVATAAREFLRAGSKNSEKLSALGYEYLDRVGVFGCKDRCPERCPVTAK